jgi:hypothetical protein
MVSKSKSSTSSQPVVAPLLTVEGSVLANSTNTNYLAFISASSAAARVKDQQSQDNLDQVDDDDNDDDNNDDDDDSTSTVNDEENFSVPQLSDIEVISNEVEISAAGIPTAKVIFKIRNSSGSQLKAVEARFDKK